MLSRPPCVPGNKWNPSPECRSFVPFQTFIRPSPPHFRDAFYATESHKNELSLSRLNVVQLSPYCPFRSYFLTRTFLNLHRSYRLLSCLCSQHGSELVDQAPPTFPIRKPIMQLGQTTAQLAVCVAYAYITDVIWRWVAVFQSVIALTVCLCVFIFWVLLPTLSQHLGEDALCTTLPGPAVVGGEVHNCRKLHLFWYAHFANCRPCA